MDIYSYKREASSARADGGLASAEFAVLDLAGSEVRLVQQFSANYTHAVNAKFESGSANLYWQTGQPQGTVNFSRLVGMNGFMEGFEKSLDGSCGSLTTLNVGMDGESACTVGAAPTGSLNFGGAIPTAYNLTWTAGALDITEGLQIRVSSLSKK